jgi:hypothetical protein
MKVYFDLSCSLDVGHYDVLTLIADTLEISGNLTLS